MIEIPLTNLEYSDLNVVIAGKQACTQSHFYGPAVREYFLIHYVIKGTGVFRCKGKEYNINKNEGFLICPNEVIYYEADKNEPWEYVWLGFNGIRAFELLQNIGLNQDSPVFNSKECEKIFTAVTQELEESQNKELYILSLLYAFFSMLSKKSYSSPKSYVSKASGYINANINNELKVGAIAKMLGLDRRYFCYVFRNEYNVSPQKYILNSRMECARSLLKNTSLSIADVARSVGYNDQLCFSKMFSKHFGSSPTAYRKAK